MKPFSPIYPLNSKPSSLGPNNINKLQMANSPFTVKSQGQSASILIQQENKEGKKSSFSDEMPFMDTFSGSIFSAPASGSTALKDPYAIKTSSYDSSSILQSNTPALKPVIDPARDVTEGTSDKPISTLAPNVMTTAIATTMATAATLLGCYLLTTGKTGLTGQSYSNQTFSNVK